ncbi:hypothetical protein ACFY3M_17980 [Streptomyces mirabilis]|uniref:hypothetical protein n=1 Tax=Streptomyces mirabilis TaxID=68239 RepID=UPI00367B4DDC
MKILAGDWWASGSFWQYVITTLAGILIGVLGAWATLRANNPKRRLNWWVESNTPLINPSLPTAGGALTVQLGGRQLRKPRTIELVLANDGRHAITSSMFHGGASVRFDFDGVGVIAILGVVTKPTGSVRPTFDIGPVTTVGGIITAEDWVDLPPSLLSRGQVVMVTVLVDGDEKDVKCVSAPLVDVDVTNQPRGASPVSVAVDLTSVRLWPLPIRVHLIP